MRFGSIEYVKDRVNGGYMPKPYGSYPSEEKPSDWTVPEEIQGEHSQLNSNIQTKYSREYLKICAFYNKMFPMLRSSYSATSSYNAPPFTAFEQERADTGTGMSSNFLKQIIDQIVSRIGTLTFEPSLIADVPTLEYIVYKDEAERMMRKMVNDSELNMMCTEVFHDAAVLGFSHVFIDPVLHIPIKANDYEIGMFESQFSADDVKHVLYRNYRFPVVSLPPYLRHCSPELVESIVSEYNRRDWCDFKMFFDCPGKRVVITVGSKTLPDIPYNFDKVQMITFGWDLGFSKVTASSLFDLLYPKQREMNRVDSKEQELIRLYKGPVPVFNSDVDLAMKAISNGTGEALFVDSSRPLDTLMTVLNPTPIDAQLSAVKTNYKSEMYELAGLSLATFDAENIRSAATMVAMSQTSDMVFQAQMRGMSRFVEKLFKMQVLYNSVVRDHENGSMSWSALNDLLCTSRAVMKPVMMTGPLGHKSDAVQIEPDYVQMALARCILKVINGETDFDSMPFTIDKTAVKMLAALTAVKLEALNIDMPDNLNRFLIDAFIDDIRQGAIKL